MKLIQIINDRVLFQDEYQNFIVYLLVKIWNGDCNFISILGRGSFVLRLQQTWLSMWKLILKYQQFFPILEEMLIHYLYKNQEDEEMEQQIFQNFKI